MSFAKTNAIIAKLHPEMQVGGFMALDGTIEFYSRVKSIVSRDSVVLDLGAGRGAWFEEDECKFRREMRLLRGHVAHVTASDVDPAVLRNKSADSANIIEDGKPLPFEDSSLDLVIADWVIEHIVNPDQFSSEITRILKPGGWFCARTPTKQNYVAFGARLISNLKHGRIVAAAQPGRKPEDVFPTAYRLNTIKDLEKFFPIKIFDNFTYLYRSEPQYHFGRVWVYRLLQFIGWLTPNSFSGNLFVFLRKI